MKSRNNLEFFKTTWGNFNLRFLRLKLFLKYHWMKKRNTENEGERGEREREIEWMRVFVFDCDNIDVCVCVWICVCGSGALLKHVWMRERERERERKRKRQQLLQPESLRHKRQKNNWKIILRSDLGWMWKYFSSSHRILSGLQKIWFWRFFPLLQIYLGFQLDLNLIKFGKNMSLFFFILPEKFLK